MITIRQITEDDIPGFWRAVDIVAREQRYITFLEGPPIEQTYDFVRGNLTGNWPHYVAIDEGDVIGWCDITSLGRPIFMHAGSLGISVLPEYRGQGIGLKLMEAALKAAKEKGLTRIELSVFTDNLPAIKLYEKMGFKCEGRKVKAAKFGELDRDMLIYALVWI